MAAKRPFNESSLPSEQQPDSSTAPHPAKRLRPQHQTQHYHHHHALARGIDLGACEPSVPDGTAVDTLVIGAVGAVCKENGFSHAQPLALEGLRGGVEECMSIYGCDYELEGGEQKKSVRLMPVNRRTSFSFLCPTVYGFCAPHGSASSRL